MTSRLAIASLAVTALAVLAACDREAPWASPDSAVSTPPVIAAVPAASSTLPAELKAESTVTEPEDAHEPAKMLGQQRLTRTDFDAMRLLATTSQGALQAYTDWAEDLKAMAEDYPVYAHILDDQVPAEAQLKTQLRAIYLSLEARAAELREHENDRAALDEVKDWRRSMEQQLTERGVQQAALEKHLKELDDAAAANAEQAVAALAEAERAAVANANTVTGEPPTPVEALQPVALASRHLIFVALATPQHSGAQLVLQKSANAPPIALKEGDAFDWYGQRVTLERVYRRTEKQLSVDFIYRGERTTIDYRGAGASSEEV